MESVVRAASGFAECARYNKRHVCVYPFSREGGINLFGDHRGSVLSNRAEISHEGLSDANLKRFQHKTYKALLLSTVPE